MARIEVKYYNSFWLKKVENSNTNRLSVWPGLPWNPTGYPTFPGTADTTAPTNNWILEESRIRGGFNENTVSLGVKAYVNEETPLQEDRSSSLIFSGIFNSRTGFNETNVFSISESIVKDLNPADGSIQKLYAENTNLNIFQERKTGYVLVNKNVIYSGAQGSAETQNIPVLGQFVPYLGVYGIGKNPESFAYFGYRKYFTDRKRNVVLRLSRDGITEISQYGMKDFFRDTLSTVNDSYVPKNIPWSITSGQSLTNPVKTFKIDIGSGSVDEDVFIGSKFLETISGALIDTGATITNITDQSTANEIEITLSKYINLDDEESSVGFLQYEYRSKIQGGWDNYNRVYTLSIQTTPSYIDEEINYSTLTFDESVSGWTSFYSFKPIQMLSLGGKFYSLFGNSIYEHHAGSTYMNYYGTQNNASISFIFNTAPSVKKNFKTIYYEGDNGWRVNSLSSGSVGPGKVYPTGTPLQYGTQNPDTALVVRSYDGGYYTDPITGQPKRAGFDRKENKYYANLVNNSIAAEGEVRFGNEMTGIKGYFATTNMVTDNTTDVGGSKEIFIVGTNFVQSS